jgi:multiple sugar transport system substrate-binding protein
MKNKKFIAAVTVLALAAPLVACGSTGGGSGGKTKVIFWHTMGKANQEILDAAIRTFQQENPDIVIEHAQKGDYNECRVAVENAIAAGDVPTMAYCYPDHVANYLTSNAVVNINDFLNNPELTFTEEDGLQSDFIEAYWEEGLSYTQEGMYSVPFSKSTEVMFYNKTVFQDHGWQVPTT